MKSTILSRILIASLVPLICIFTLLLITVNNMIYSISAGYAESKTLFITEQTASRLENKVSVMERLTALASVDLQQVDIKMRGATDVAGKQLLNLIESAPYIYNAWFAFEPDTIVKDIGYAKSYTSSDGTVKESHALEYDILKAPRETARYYIPLTTGQPYFNTVDYVDYGDGKGGQYICSIMYPIYYNSQVVGVIGADILYDDLFAILDGVRYESDITILLMTCDGAVLYPSEYSGRSINELGLSNIERLNGSLESGVSFMQEIESPFSDGLSLMHLYPVDIELGANQLFLLFDLPSNTLYIEAQRSVQAIVYTSVMGLVLLSASVYFVTRNIVKPIKVITNNALNIANGQFDVEIGEIDEDPKTRDEVAILQKALKKMLKEMITNHELKVEIMEANFEKERTEAASEARSRYFANMSHEIRTPMNAILGMSELLLTENLSETQKKYVTNIRVSSNALLDLVNDILDLSKMDAESFELIPVNYNLKILLDNINSLSVFLSTQKGLRYDYEAGFDLPDCLYGDDTRLRQVLLNIISNAVKFTNEGSIKLRVDYSDNCLVFDVSDTGVGIKPEALPQLFQLFKRFDSEKNRNITGTGLGLTITKNLVELMGGEITVDSVYGKGSIFHVKIPVTLGDREKLITREDSVRVFTAPTAKILVVDDNEINLNVASGLLNLYDINCDTALSGREAIEKVQETDYDIVFMDHMMPEMDGTETTKKIRELGEKYQRLTIIALTANAMSGMREFLMSSGMNDFISKPIVKASLDEILSAWIPDLKKVKCEDVVVHVDEGYSEILRKAASIEDLDVKLGLDRVGNQHDIYEKSLRLAGNKIPIFAEEIRNALEEGDTKTFHVLIHGMKGVLANIGAMSLSEFGLRLEKKSNDMDYCRANLPEFLNLLQYFGKNLDVLFSDDEEMELLPGDVTFFHREIKKLTTALKDYDYVTAGDAMNALMKFDYGEETNNSLIKIKMLVEQFDYDTAVEIIKGMSNDA